MDGSFPSRRSPLAYLINWSMLLSTVARGSIIRESRISLSPKLQYWVLYFKGECKTEQFRLEMIWRITLGYFSIIQDHRSIQILQSRFQNLLNRSPYRTSSYFHHSKFPSSIRNIYIFCNHPSPDVQVSTRPLAKSYIFCSITALTSACNNWRYSSLDADRWIFV